MRSCQRTPGQAGNCSVRLEVPAFLLEARVLFHDVKARQILMLGQIHGFEWVFATKDFPEWSAAAPRLPASANSLGIALGTWVVVVHITPPA